jgi:predicted transposase YbfD/YdcC
MLPKFQVPAQQHVDCDKGHGRVELRTVQTFVPPAGWLPPGWEPLVKAVVKVTREVTHKRRGTTELSSETAWWVGTVCLDAEQFQAAIRGHWCIENQNHHVRDVVLFEDACRIREHPGILARLRSIALNCMRLNKVSSISRALYRNALNFDCAVSMLEEEVNSPAQVMNTEGIDHI